MWDIEQLNHNVGSTTQSGGKMKAIRTILVLGAVAGLMFSSAAFAQSAADLYKSKCAACHGADGSKEMPAMGVKPLSGADVQKKSDAELTDAIAKGKGKMQPFAGKLTDDQIKSLVAYVRTLKK
jgi:mono/diheme cytochrome c family protein